MAENAPTRKQGWMRRGFRWCRIAGLLVLLCLLIGFIWLNQVGLPGFVKNPILAELRSRGIELQFDRIRLRWYHGIVAEKVIVGRATAGESPFVQADQVTVRINGSAISKGSFQVDGLLLENGRLQFPMPASNQPPYSLVVTNIQSELVLLPGDQWELTSLKGDALGCQFAATASVTNASLIPPLLRKQTTTKGPPKAPTPRSFQTLRRIFEEIEAAQFSRPPSLSLHLRADGGNTNDYHLDFKLAADNAVTRWGNVRDLILHIPISPVKGTNGLAGTDLMLSFNKLTSEHLNTGRTRLDVHAVQSVTNPLPMEVSVKLDNRLLKSPHGTIDGLRIAASTRPHTGAFSNLWHTSLIIDAESIAAKPARASTLHTALEMDHTLTNFSLSRISGDAQAGDLVTDWIKASSVHLATTGTTFTNRFLPNTSSMALKITGPESKWGKADAVSLAGDFTWNHGTNAVSADASLADWTNAWPFTTRSSLVVTNLHTPQVDIGDARVGIDWHPPVLKVTGFDGRLYDGSLDFDASMDVSTRLTQIKGTSDFDIMKTLHLFKPQTREWLGQHEFEKPPQLFFKAMGILPAWTNSAPEWEAEVLPTVLVEGDVRVGRGAFRTVPYTAASTSLRLSGNTLEITELIAHRPEGTGRARYRSDIKTRDYYWQFDSKLDPKAALPFFETESQKRVLNDFTFTVPPHLSGELWGRWGSPKLTGGHADIALTNVTYRGGAFSNVTASASYTNLVASVTNITVQNGPQIIKADGAMADIRNERLWFTNVNSTFDPYMFTKVIGQSTYRAIEAYQFAQPPTVHLTGSMHFNDEDQTDLHFDIQGGPFHYWKFNFDHIRGQVHWVTNTLTITNVQARGYDGNVLWNGFFDFAPPERTDFQFKSEFSNLDLQPLLRDLNSRPSSSQGRIDGTLTITDANALEMNSWNGHGRARLQDGFLWDIPMVGLFSGALNAIVPGLGKSRIKEGEGDFIVTNSVVRTRNLELKSPAMRLLYRGTVDMEGRVDAEVEAELLRDAWVVGRIFSLAMAPITKAFVYKVTGTLNDPKSEPLYIPKLLLYPFKPLKVLKDLITDDNPKDKKPDEKPDNPAP